MISSSAACLKMKTVELKTRNIASTKTIHHVDMTAMIPIIVIILSYMGNPYPSSDDDDG
jgi:hypothetical protein